MNTFEKYISSINSKLTQYFNDKNNNYHRVTEAMEYSISAGGKRIRPVLTLAFCKACGGEVKNSLAVACAIEMMHTFSLIHDDLPCMDNDDYRRGRESCHKKFDEATALLAGDALAIYPFQVIAESAQKGEISCEAAIRISRLFAECAGKDGMIAGQQIDIENEGKTPSDALLTKMYILKTSELLKIACCSGCIAAGGSDEQVEFASEYAKNLGLAFQIVDDILDITGDAKMLGKPVGSDEKSGKVTYATLHGVEQSQKKAAELTDNALRCLSHFDNDEFLVELTNMLLNRNK